MNIENLRESLDFNGIPSESYSLVGGLPNEALCLSRLSESKWVTYYSERGIKSNLMTHSTEDIACRFFLSMILPNFRGISRDNSDFFSEAVQQYFGVGQSAIPRSGEHLESKFEIFRPEVNAILLSMRLQTIDLSKPDLTTVNTFYRERLKVYYPWLSHSDIAAFTWNLTYDWK